MFAWLIKFYRALQKKKSSEAAFLKGRKMRPKAKWGLGHVFLGRIL